jgi:hypothetical protein
MKVITLRNIPPEVAHPLAARAKERGASASRTVIKILEEYFQGGSNGRGDGLHHDLDDLAGCWPAEQTASFNESLREQRAIEPDAWE